MGCLVKDEPIAGYQFMARPWAVHELIKVSGVDHAQRAQLAAFHDLSHLAHRRIEAMGVAAQQLDLVLVRGVIHFFGIVDGQSHGLFDDDMFAMLGRDQGVLGVHLRRRGDVDRVDVSAFAEILDVIISLGVKFFFKYI